jgi:hypothetical protein
MGVIVGRAIAQVNLLEGEAGSKTRQGFLNHLTDNLSSANHRSYSHPSVESHQSPAEGTA